jgi:hypothetical protein
MHNIKNFFSLCTHVFLIMWAIENFFVLELSKICIYFPLYLMMSIFGQCIAFIGGVTDEYCIGKNLEGSACSLVVIVSWNSGVPWGGVWGVQTPPPPPPKFRSFDKAKPNSQFHGKYIRNNLIRIRVSPICKLSGTPD